jgi:alcohol dehydrogenase (NADP+)
MTRTTTGWAAMAAGQPLQPWTFERRDLRPDDVAVRVSHVGVCFTDLDLTRAPGSPYPLVPGHEMVGTVTAVGDAVTEHAVGDSVAVGNVVDSCGVCPACRSGDEQFCREFPTLTYAGRDRHDGSLTQGGYAEEILARETFVHPLPAQLDGENRAAAAPLLCAGITTYVPLRTWEVQPGQTVGVVGIGGIGHLSVKLAKAMGAEVVAFTRTPAKAQEATALGADEVVLSTDEDAMAAQRERFDLILDTVPRPHDLSAYLTALRFDRTFVSLGIQEQMPFDSQALRFGRKRLSGAGSGGPGATREMLAFCAEHGITADVETLPAAQVNEAMARLDRGDVRYRFVLSL